MMQGGKAMSLITSFQNPRVKRIRSLRHRKYRRSEGCFLVEGIRIVEEALDRGAPLESLVYSPDLLVSERARALVERVGPAQHLALSGEVFRTLSNRQHSQGIAAVVRIVDRSPGAVALTDDTLIIVAFQLRDPGNLGSIIRTADAAGATCVVVIEPSVDLYDPNTVRATMGSLFALPIIRMRELAELRSWYSDIHHEGFAPLILASSAHGEQIIFDVECCGPVVLLVGSERHGLPASVFKDATVTVRLPMAGRATSLNVSAAAAALVYEIIRQRRARIP
jgi:TrmH family RNA methyltransferase